ncbi:MAG: Arm DNA-binding domain-containing protein [Cyclobacteriaceae bacterium]
METTYSVITFLKNNKAGHGRALIYLRITVKGQRQEISIKRKIDPERWDSGSNRMKGNREDAKEVNSLIDKLILKLNKIYQRLVENDEMITATRIKEIYLGKDVRNRTLLEVFELHNEMMKSRVGVDFSTSTYTRYQTTYDHVSNFLLHQYKMEDIFLKQIQYSFITDLAIGTNINQITHAFHTSETESQKMFHALKVAQQYRRVEEKVECLLAMIADLGRKWLERTERKTKVEMRLPDFDEDA